MFPNCDKRTPNPVCLTSSPLRPVRKILYDSIAAATQGFWDRPGGGGLPGHLFRIHSGPWRTKILCHCESGKQHPKLGTVALFKTLGENAAGVVQQAKPRRGMPVPIKGFGFRDYSTLKGTREENPITAP